MAATHPTCPSRDFLIRQAVLNAALRFNPIAPMLGPTETWAPVWLGALNKAVPGKIPGYFESAVCTEFRVLAGRYGVQVAA